MGNKLAQQVEKSTGFFASLSMEQLLGLIDGKDQRWGLVLPVVCVGSRARLDEVLQERRDARCA